MKPISSSHMCEFSRKLLKLSSRSDIRSAGMFIWWECQLCSAAYAVGTPTGSITKEILVSEEHEINPEVLITKRILKLSKNNRTVS